MLQKLLSLLKKFFLYLSLRKKNVVVPLLAGTAKTLVVSMLSEKVVLRVLVMLSEWTAAKSTNSLDNRLVLEIKTMFEADGMF